MNNLLNLENAEFAFDHASEDACDERASHIRHTSYDQIRTMFFAECLITVKEMAEMLAMSHSTAKKIITSGKIATVTVGPRSKRIRLQTIIEYVESHTTSPTAG